MNDLHEDPKKVAADIIAQGTKGLKFASEAEKRVLDILNAYHNSQDNYSKLEHEMEELETKTKAEAEIIEEGEVCWKIVGSSKKGPYCSRCWIKDKVLMPMRECGSGIHACIECTNSWDDGTYQKPKDESGGFSLLDV